jgi:VCBS repeat-containing protein
MKQLFIALAAVSSIFFVSCDNTDMLEDYNLDVMSTPKSNNNTPNDYVERTVYSHDVEQTSFEEAMIKFYEVSIYHSGKKDSTVIEAQPVNLLVNLIDLGRHETSKENWRTMNVVGTMTSSDGVSETGYGHVTLAHIETIYTNTLTNGAIEVPSKYTFDTEKVIWTYGDTTIVVEPFALNVEEVSTSCDEEGKLINTIKATYGSFVEQFSETGTVWQQDTPVVPEEPVITGRRFEGAKFSATVDPQSANSWMFGATLTFSDGVYALSLDKNGKPMNGNFWSGIKDPALNGAFYVARYGKWYPVIASDLNACMQWALCAAQGNYGLYALDYSGADTYGDWNNNDKGHNGQHTVHTDRLRVEDNPSTHTITLFYNGVNKGSWTYGE